MQQNPVKPLASMIVFAYRQEDYVRAAIESAFAQTYQPLEIILSDDGSPDGTFEMMRECAQNYDGPHKVVLRPKSANLGMVAHLNALVGMAGGEVVSWLAGDDIAEPNRMEQLVQPMLEDAGVMATHSAVQEMDEQGNPLRIRRRAEEGRAISLAYVCSQGQGLVAQSCAFRKHLWSVFGDLSPELSNEGPVMGFRAAALGKVIYVDETLTRYRIGTGVSTAQTTDAKTAKQDEPIKIAHWRMSAFNHMLADAAKMQSALAPDLLRALQKNAAYASALYAMNKGEQPLRSLFMALAAKPFDLRAPRALLRILAPLALYRKLRAH